jgi:hypothetical protein
MKHLRWFGVAIFLCAGFTLAGIRVRGTIKDVDGLSAPAQQPDWQIHANWCANVDHGSSHGVYLRACHHGEHDQYYSVLECQKDAAKNNDDGGAAVKAITDAGPAKVNDYMKDKCPEDCKPQ